jgi:pimeloyl-ACP methyl ester carboxylesterase
MTAANDARPAIVIGNSRGGAIAIDHALAHPDEVSALVLVAPSPSGYDDARWPTMAAEDELDHRIAAAEQDGDLELVNQLEVRYWLDGVEQEEGRVTGDARRLMSEMNGRALRASPIGDPTERSSAWERLAELTMPVLVVCGEYDLDGCRQLCDELAAAVPRARRVDIAASAHCPQLDQPHALAQVVLGFMDSLANGESA